MPDFSRVYEVSGRKLSLAEICTLKGMAAHDHALEHGLGQSHANEAFSSAFWGHARKIDGWTAATLDRIFEAMEDLLHKQAA